MNDEYPYSDPHEPTNRLSKNLAKLSPFISFIDDENNEQGAYYSMLQGHRISKNNRHLRVWFTHTVLDVTTTDARALRNLIYQRSYSEIRQGQSYEGTDITNITMYSDNGIPIKHND